jgi:hypothetical protein
MENAQKFKNIFKNFFLKNLKISNKILKLFFTTYIHGLIYKYKNKVLIVFIK